MPESYIHPGEPRTPTVPPGHPARVIPTASRMFAKYLSDLGQLLDEHRWDAAAREADDLPRIAVALSHPHLHASSEEIRNWCQLWIRPLEGDAAGPVVHSDAADGASLTARALRRLRLRRHVRHPPRGFSPARADNLGVRDSAVLKRCEALLEAARRWYARSAVHDPIVQANLARLAVLR
ncbi:MAG: hypothetical protein PVS2B3_13900 [Steroidobacteraceae bacterium]